MNNNFLVRALKARRKHVAPNSNNNNNNKRNFIKKSKNVNNSTNYKTEFTDSKKSKNVNNKKELFGSMGEFFIQLAANNSRNKNRLIAQKEKEINELGKKLRITKALLRHMRSPVVRKLH